MKIWKNVKAFIHAKTADKSGSRTPSVNSIEAWRQDVYTSSLESSPPTTPLARVSPRIANHQGGGLVALPSGYKSLINSDGNTARTYKRVTSTDIERLRDYFSSHGTTTGFDWEA